MLLGAVPTLYNFAFSVGFSPPRSANLNWDIISFRTGYQQLVPVLDGFESDVLMLNTRTTPSIVTLTTRSPSLAEEPAMIWTPMLTVVCCPNRTIFVPARQSQQTSALSAPADTRFFELNATARIPFKCPASCCKGVYVKEEKRCTRLNTCVSNAKEKIRS